MDDRLTAAEEQIAHLARMVEDLSGVIAGHQAEIARLSRRVALLTEREADREVDAGATIPLADERPPHW